VNVYVFCWLHDVCVYILWVLRLNYVHRTEMWKSRKLNLVFHVTHRHRFTCKKVCGWQYTNWYHVRSSI